MPVSSFTICSLATSVKPKWPWFTPIDRHAVGRKLARHGKKSAVAAEHNHQMAASPKVSLLTTAQRALVGGGDDAVGQTLALVEIRFASFCTHKNSISSVQHGFDLGGLRAGDNVDVF